MSISDFTIAVGPYTGSGPVQALTFYNSWTLDKNLDDGCTFSFTIPGYVPEAAYLSELDTDIWVYRSGVLTERFRIVAINQQWGPSGEDVISVQAVCYRRLLATRYVQTPLRFDQVSQGQIIWQLIQHTQATTNGDLGITLGDAGPNVLRDRTYEVGQNILDIIVDLTNVIGGPTWDINENLELIVSRSDLFPFNPTPIMLGATAQSFQRPSAASKFGNVAVISGNQQSTTTEIVESSGLPTDPRGRWERRAAYPSVVLQGTLTDHANGLLTELQAPTSIWQVDVVPERFFGDADYELGEFVGVVQPASTAAPIGQSAETVYGQILAIQIQQSADGAIDVSMRVLEIGTSGLTVVGASSDVTAGGYRTVTWLDDGRFSVFGDSLSVEYLIVAGGGGGGLSGGGGGGGGVRTGTTTVSNINAIIGVGNGGLDGRSTANGRGMNGGDSFALGLSATGGGGGGGGIQNVSSTARNGASGGSGGGGGPWFGSGTGGAGTSGQGNAGGNAVDTSPWMSGGGGGATQAGGNGGATANSGGKGGDGLTSSISGTSTVYGGGGGGGVNANTGNIGAGGSGGGGAGGRGNIAATVGTDGRGGGGGGGGPAPAKGGSGVVILKWAV